MTVPKETNTAVSGEETSISVDGPWKLSLKKAGEEKFVYERDLLTLKNITSSQFLPDFSGTMKYETTVEIEKSELCQRGILDLGEVYETAEVWVNGSCVGCQFAAISI